MILPGGSALPCPPSCRRSERAVVASVGNGVRVAEFLTRPRPYDTSSPEGRGLNLILVPCPSSPSPTARPARSRQRPAHRRVGTSTRSPRRPHGLGLSRHRTQLPRLRGLLRNSSFIRGAC